MNTTQGYSSLVTHHSSLITTRWVGVRYGWLGRSVKPLRFTRVGSNPTRPATTLWDSSVVERLIVNQDAGGSNPSPTAICIREHLAQWIERHSAKVEAGGSTPPMLTVRRERLNLLLHHKHAKHEGESNSNIPPSTFNHTGIAQRSGYSIWIRVVGSSNLPPRTTRCVRSGAGHLIVNQEITSSNLVRTALALLDGTLPLYSSGYVAHVGMALQRLVGATRLDQETVPKTVTTPRVLRVRVPSLPHSNGLLRVVNC